jgi:uncharacterized protein (DUF433 family)
MAARADASSRKRQRSGLSARFLRRLLLGEAADLCGTVGRGASGDREGAVRSRWDDAWTDTLTSGVQNVTVRPRCTGAHGRSGRTATLPTATAPYVLAEDDPRAAWAIFTVFEAARYLGIPNSTLRTWIEPGDGGPPMVSSFDRRGHQPRISFIGFAEAFVISAARRAGVRPHRIREGVEAVRRSIGVDYALATRRLYVDKAELLVAPEGGVDVEEPEDLEVARTRQIQMTRTVKKQLKHITYGDDGVAASLTLPNFQTAKVIVDPHQAFGAPIISRTGTRVRDIVSLWRADEDLRDIAYDFDLTFEEVQDVIRAQAQRTTS